MVDQSLNEPSRPSTSFDDVVTTAINFRDARDWKQFHNPKDLAISISLEASELLELFQWSGADLNPKDAAAARDELADIMIYCIYFADALGIDIPAAIADKLKENEERYPISKAKGSSAKHTEL
jgi:NTP pyrophosphatase (non-canonical NTP hydrolase)